MHTETDSYETPTELLGTKVIFQDEGDGVVTREDEDSIFIESSFFTGSMLKTEYYELLGVED